MTDFDFAGFLDTDNQKNFAISLIKLFDSIILDQNAEQILHHVNEVQKNSICNDFGGLVSALSNFNLKNISSKLSLLSVINLITPNLSVSDQLNDDWEKTFKISKDVILKKFDVLFVGSTSDYRKKNLKKIMDKNIKLVSGFKIFPFVPNDKFPLASVFIT